jgi:hypothetical protein
VTVDEGMYSLVGSDNELRFFCVKMASFNVMLFFIEINVEVQSYLVLGREHITSCFLCR